MREYLEFLEELSYDGNDEYFDCGDKIQWWKRDQLYMTASIDEEKRQEIENCSSIDFVNIELDWGC